MADVLTADEKEAVVELGEYVNWAKGPPPRFRVKACLELIDRLAADNKRMRKTIKRACNHLLKRHPVVAMDELWAEISKKEAE